MLQEIDTVTLSAKRAAGELLPISRISGSLTTNAANWRAGTFAPQTNPAELAAADLINNRVIPFYEKHDIACLDRPGDRILRIPLRAGTRTRWCSMSESSHLAAGSGFFESSSSTAAWLQRNASLSRME